MFVLYLVILSLSTSLANSQPKILDKSIYELSKKIMSTLGEYQMVFYDSCQYAVQKFSNGTYVRVGELKGTYFNATNIKCAMAGLNYKERSLVMFSANNEVVSSLQINNSKSSCHEMTLTIDDLGTIRLTCIPESGMDYIQWQSKINITHASNRLCLSNFFMNQSYSTGIHQNKGDWKIWIKNATLEMSHSDVRKNLSYHVGQFRILPQNIYGQNSKQGPVLKTPRIDFRPRCNFIKSSKFYTPFLFEFNDKYPLLEVMDQTGYVILSLQYPFFECGVDVYHRDSFHQHCHTPVCPPEMFLFGTQCVFDCPSPYYSFIRSGLVNKCVLNCQQSSIVDSRLRTCSCQVINNQCPDDAQPYFGGCKCSTGFYLEQRCLQRCPTGFYGYNNVCISCPKYCKECVLSNGNTTFLECIQCRYNFQKKDQFCISTNSPLRQQSERKCKDPNCIECIQQCENGVNCTAQCLSCSPFFILVNSSECRLTVPPQEILLYSKYGKFTTKQKQNKECQSWSITYVGNNGYVVCTSCTPSYSRYSLYGEGCLENCRKSGALVYDEGRVCKCIQLKIMIVSECQKKPLCPIGMFLNQTLQTCMQCDFGCVSCIQNSSAGNTTFCTSCAPGYVLFIHNTARCYLNSILLECPSQLRYQGGRCIPKNESQPLYTNCINNDGSCRICLSDSYHICLLCKQGFYLTTNIHNEKSTKCLDTCPDDTIPYNGVCILNGQTSYGSSGQEVCTKFRVRNVYNYGLLNKTVIDQRRTFGFYQNNSKKPQNNIMGVVIDRLKLEGYHTSKIFQPALFCENCISGYALNRTIGVCRQCPQGCQTCYQPADNSCQSCLQPAYQKVNSSCKKIHQICTEKNNFRNNRYACIDMCDTYFLDNKTGINCTNSCPKQTFPSLSTPDLRFKTNNKSLMACYGLHLLPKSMDKQTPHIPIYASLFVTSDGRPTAIFVPESQFNRKMDMPWPQEIIYYHKHPGGINTTRGRLSLFRPTFLYYQLSTQLNPVCASLWLKSSQLSYLTDSRGRYLANSQYGIKANADFRTHIQQDVFYFGVICSLLTIVAHIVFIANLLPFRAENFLIFIQTVGTFLYIRLPAQLQLTMFYNGFTVSNIRFMYSILGDRVPHGYLQPSPVMFKLMNQDCNIIRNTGQILTFYMVMIPLCIIVPSVLYLLRNKGQFWFPRQIPYYLFSTLSFPLLIINYFSCLQLKYGDRLDYQPTQHQFLVLQDLKKFNELSINVAILPLLWSLVFLAFCWLRSRMLFLYSAKRVLIGIVMALGIANTHVGRLVILIEVVFTLGRCFVDELFFFRDYLTMILEAAMFIVVYSLIWSQTGIFSIIAISVVALFNLVMLLYGMGSLLSAMWLKQINKMSTKASRDTSFTD